MFEVMIFISREGRDGNNFFLPSIFPFHPSPPSRPPPLHLLLQAIGWSYKCHSVHGRVAQAHLRSPIWGDAMFALRFFKLYLHHFLFLSITYLGCTPRSLSNLKKNQHVKASYNMCSSLYKKYYLNLLIQHMSELKWNLCFENLLLFFLNCTHWVTIQGVYLKQRVLEMLYKSRNW